ncbi:hypothetical protein [Aurantiacibacter spongiae]|uniref:Uncharacterized protein n=1 Tax=Aurantiacibacter spongiae TaxID=2488860 RepID=A0A3N5CXY4_9SPHN|nr:hypothetical protein [Aurantiacibacter spongiae]RPF71499.1 hypothetical protein EG799_07640 [Aurantiacibacter spongiae]
MADRIACRTRDFVSNKASIMKLPVRIAVLSVACLLAGCGQNLGTYAVESVHIATSPPVRAKTAAYYGEFLEIRLRSETNLTALADAVDSVYVHADFCPLSNPRGLIAFGPYSGNGDDLGLLSASPVLQPGTDDAFHYRVYVPVAHREVRPETSGQVRLPTYDLRETKDDLCLRLFSPGYNITDSRSKTIRVPAKMIPALE